ncbi:MAG: FAD-binding oxidoreductase, partial [Marivirga sp.]|nr:FAD-binding oxidoreductase [Marivirga sp.]
KLKATGDTRNHQLLLDQYQYDGLETCAVDGLCAPACPVDINTGDLVKRLRRENHSSFSNALALRVAKNFGLMEKSARLALRIGVGINRIFGKGVMTSLTAKAKKLFPAIPLWTSEITGAPDLSALKKHHREPSSKSGGTTIVYFPSCISRMLGTYPGKEKNLIETFFSVCKKAGVNVIVSENFNGTCCSQIFSSKGYSDAYRFTANKIINHLWESTHEGLYAVVIDVSSCAHTLHSLRPSLGPENQAKFDRLKIMDSVDFLHDYILPAAPTVKKKNSIAVHSVCSLQKMKTEDMFVNVARHFAENVMAPKHTGCCGMAGDRGFMFPELTDSATAEESSEVKQNHYDGYYSSTKTCEMAMSKAVGQGYESILYLADETMEKS